MKRIFPAIQNALDRIENMHITPAGWLLSFAGVIFVRIFLENFSDVPVTGNWASDASTVVHYYLYYLASALSIMLLLAAVIGRKKIERIMLIALAGNAFAPIFDLVTTGGKGHFQHYIFTDGTGLLRTFFAFFTWAAIPGITPGMRVGFVLGMIIVLWYVIHSTKSAVKGIVIAAAGYAITFFWGAFPSFWKLAYDAFTPWARSIPVAYFFWLSETASVIAKNFLYPAMQLSTARAEEVFFNVAMSHLYYITISLLAAAYFFLHYREKFVELLKNSRQLRAFHYYALIAAGIVFGIRLSPIPPLWNWLSTSSLVVLLIASFCARMYAGGVNDIEDAAIDRISNPGRPFPAGRLSVADIQNANVFLLPWALIGAFLVGQYVLFAAIAGLLISYIYSSPPLRLRNYPIVATFLIAVASFAAFASGFYFINADMATTALPGSYVVLIIITLTLAENVKDLKDIEGDRAAGSWSIPVLFGKETGRRMIAVFVAAAFMLPPVILQLPSLWLPSILAATIAYPLIDRKNYRELPVIVVGTLYAVVAIFLALM